MAILDEKWQGENACRGRRKKKQGVGFGAGGAGEKRYTIKTHLTIE